MVLIPAGALLLPLIGGFNEWSFWKTYFMGFGFILILAFVQGFPMSRDEVEGDVIANKVFYAFFAPAFLYVVGWSASTVLNFIKSVIANMWNML